MYNLKKIFEMDRIKFEFDGRLEGGFPIEEEDIETITELDFYDQLIDFIEERNEKEPGKKGIPLNWDTPEGMGK